MKISAPSVAGPDGVPVAFKKKAKDTIDRPLALLLKQRITERSIVTVHNMASIVPQH